MKVYINSQNEIKDVNTTTDSTFTAVEIPEGVFDNWSVAKICCHKIDLENGQYVGFAPYVDTRIIEHIERLGTENEHNAEQATFLAEQSEVLTATVDSLLTDIIPSLFGL